jgi:flavin-dependent dehydrogenase
VRTVHDVVIVGARVAGAATGLLLARLGYDVVVVDRAVLPSDTISTHSISRSGVVQLHRWGLLRKVLDSGAPAIQQVTFHGPDGATTRSIKQRSGVGYLVAPRRQALDTIVATAARQAGADLRLGLTVTAVRHSEGRVVGVSGYDIEGTPVEIAARYVVGADGLRSQVARSVNARLTEAHHANGATQYAYYAGPAWEGIEFFVAERSLAGVFPTNGGEACIWVCSPTADAKAIRQQSGSREAAFAEYLRRSAPQLAERLHGARRTSPVSGMLRMPNQLREAVGPGWALVGDAGYHRDAVTGHGISDAFRDAELLATALDRALRGDQTAMVGYHRRRDAALREMFDLTRALAAYPPLPMFVELHKRVSAVIEKEAATLAARPGPGEQLLACV